MYTDHMVPKNNLKFLHVTRLYVYSSLHPRLRLYLANTTESRERERNTPKKLAAINLLANKYLHNNFKAATIY